MSIVGVATQCALIVNVYKIEPTDSLITCSVEISNVNGYSASRIIVLDLSGNSLMETIALSHDLSGNINRVNVGRSLELKNKRVSFLTNVELFDSEDVESTKKKIFARYSFDGGLEGNKTFNSPIRSTGKTSVSFLMQVDLK